MNVKKLIYIALAVLGILACLLVPLFLHLKHLDEKQSVIPKIVIPEQMIPAPSASPVPEKKSDVHLAPLLLAPSPALKKK